MTDEERARRALERAVPGDRVAQLRCFPPFYVAEMESYESYKVQLPSGLDPREQKHRAQGFSIVLVTPRIDPPPLVHGVALFDDGAAYRLDDPADLVAFHRRAAGAFDPLDLADLLVAYQSDGDGFLIATLSVLDGLEPERPIPSLPGFTLPVVEGSTLRFWSAVLDRGDGGPTRLFCTSWNVTGLDGGLSWRKEAVAPIRCRGGRTAW